ncbi:hypothetical protein Tco_1555825 [Tanacetum coccineum]
MKWTEFCSQVARQQSSINLLQRSFQFKSGPSLTSHYLDSSLNLVVYGGKTEIRDIQSKDVPSVVVLDPMPVYLEVGTVRSKNSHRPAPEVHLIRLIEPFGDHSQS